ncbi:MAG: DUF971 domain-containing protein [Xanthomonadales bacterium]|nr:DUF971 domain-containing protein [Xanthomonadales bacterium]
MRVSARDEPIGRSSGPWTRSAGARLGQVAGRHSGHPPHRQLRRIVFDDGHDTGIYSWDTLYRLGREQSQRWADYLQALREAGQSRDAPIASSDTGEQA